MKLSLSSSVASLFKQSAGRKGLLNKFGKIRGLNWLESLSMRPSRLEELALSLIQRD
jgi:hypothetical protein